MQDCHRELGGGNWVEVYAGASTDLLAAYDALVAHGYDPAVFDESGERAFLLGLNSVRLGRVGVARNRAEQARALLTDLAKKQRQHVNDCARRMLMSLSWAIAVAGLVIAAFVSLYPRWQSALWVCIPIACLTAYMIGRLRRLCFRRRIREHNDST